jgi:hypothetical protein
MSLFSTSCRTLTLTALAVLAFSAPAVAQDKGSVSFSFGGNGPGVMLGGPMSMRGPAKFGAIDPAYRNIGGLLQRNDVRSEIVLSAKQREEMEAVAKGEKANPPKPLKFEFKSEDGPGSPEAMREKVERQMREIFSSTMDERNKKVESVLRPEQLRRLNELDVQWRGPLALVDPKLAEKVELDDEQRQKVQALYQEYRATQSKIMGEAMKEFTETQENNDSAEGNVRRSVAVRIRIPDEKDMTPKQRALIEKRDKDIEEARKALGEKALALLSADQKQALYALQGKKFTFRLVD